MNPEQLKIIAERVYPERNWIISDGSQWGAKKGQVIYTDKFRSVLRSTFDPLTNDTQCMEIMEKLVRENVGLGFAPLVNNKIHLCVDVYDGTTKEIIKKGKTINEAVCLAAYEFLKNAQTG